MKNYFFLSVMSLFLFLAILIACQNDPLEPEQGTVSLTFDNVVGTQDLRLDTSAVYKNGSGESFSVSRLNYFVSNIRLQKADGSEYVIPQDSSYFLVEESNPASQTFALRNIPAGDYTSLSFVLGVDSLRNTMGIDKRTGALDPAGTAAGMYWDWNSGYIFLKLEGTSPQAPVDATGKRNFVYHVGLFGGYSSKTINNLRTIPLSFSTTPARVVMDGTTRITIKADVLKVFDGVKPLSIAKNANIMVSPLSADIATNYATMFSVSNVKVN
ncbi:MbnP family protein [Larkinella sp. VNQ87]|uniref:MbnP family protein n=1 Tax=Larkinella sp. VNQ87 TaxID=3400921 RepID=UPI003C01DA18